MIFKNSLFYQILRKTLHKYEIRYNLSCFWEKGINLHFSGGLFMTYDNLMFMEMVYGDLHVSD